MQALDHRISRLGCQSALLKVRLDLTSGVGDLLATCLIQPMTEDIQKHLLLLERELGNGVDCLIQGHGMDHGCHSLKLAKGWSLPTWGVNASRMPSGQLDLFQRQNPQQQQGPNLRQQSTHGY
ncbi:hypothetical protein [Halochromatium roseum]|uniref:hypothetical protein n=1 Tax=Halochromatium roseum TaxID=391920 RepID=UPI0019128F01|nr:hypothetical protein [Halochromatium roseum]